MDDIPEDTGIVLLTIMGEGNGFIDSEFNKDEAEYTFLHSTLGWDEGMKNKDIYGKRKNTRRKKGITKLPGYLFLTDQIGWKQGLYVDVLGERGEKAIEKDLQQIHDMDGFQPKRWYELTTSSALTKTTSAVATNTTPRHCMRHTSC